jgi:hypothetical protein
MARRGVLAVLLLAAGLVLPARAQAPLEWKLKKGDRFYVRNFTETKQTLKAVGKEVPQSFKQTVVLGFTVEDQTPKGVVLKETVEWVEIKPENGDPVSEDRIVGASFTILLSPKWEVIEFEGYAQLLDKLAGDDVAARQALQATVSEDALKKSVRELMAFLPDRPVKEGGDPWARTVEQPFGALGTLLETRTYKLEGKGDLGGKKVDRITFTSAVEYKAGKPDKALAYHVISGEMKADEAKGTVHFDPDAGRVVQIESRMKLRGRMVLSIAGSNVDAVVEQEQKTEVAVLSEKPARK